VIEAAEPFIVNLTHGGRLEAMDDPLKTITCAHRGEKALVMPTLVVNTSGHGPADIGEPVHTVTTGNHHALVAPLLVGAGGPAYGGKPTAADKPFGTLLGENHQALVTAFLAKHYTGVVGHGPDQPLGSVTTVDHHSLVTAHLQRDFGNSVGHRADEPSGTITPGGGGKEALITSNLIKFRGTCRDGQPTDKPLPTITGGGTHIGEVRAFLVKYFGTATGQDLRDPAHTVTAKHRLGLVTVAGEDYAIADIGMRMLTPRELFRAQGFPDSYIIDPVYNGKPLPLYAQVRACGNSVCPPMAAALVRANCADMIRMEATA